MELRRISLWLALFVIAAISQSSEGHSVQKRETGNDLDYNDPALADEGSDDEAQNDADGNIEGDEDDELPFNASILTAPASYTVTVGKTIRLECKIDPPNADAVVQWLGVNKTTYFFGRLKTDSDERFSLDPGTTDLLIRDVRPSDSGTYRCELIQKDKKSTEHRLIVSESPRILNLTATNNGKVKVGSELVLTCDVSGTPPPTIKWSKSVIKDGREENVNLNESSGRFIANTVTMTASRDAAGTYLCWAFNTAGSTQKKIDVVVTDKPHVNVPEPYENADIGVTVQLTCSVDEKPTPTFRWTKDGVDIEEREHYFKLETNGGTSVLSVTPASDSDFGTFTCHAVNEHGEHAKSVSVVAAPVVRALAATRGSLAWTVASHRPLVEATLTLRDDEDKLYTFDVPVPTERHHIHNMEFTIPDQDLRGKFEATVKVKNDKGWSQETEPVMVDLEEHPVQSPTVVASIFGGSENGCNSPRPATAVVTSTLLMYLLVRTL